MRRGNILCSWVRWLILICGGARYLGWIREGVGGKCVWADHHYSLEERGHNVAAKSSDTSQFSCRQLWKWAFCSLRLWVLGQTTPYFQVSDRFIWFQKTMALGLVPHCLLRRIRYYRPKKKRRIRYIQYLKVANFRWQKKKLHTVHQCCISSREFFYWKYFFVMKNLLNHKSLKVTKIREAIY